MQAARGTSLNPSGESPSQPSAPASGRRSIVVFALVALVAYVVDQASKAIALDRLHPGETVSVVGDLLTLTLVRNPGASFGIGERYTWAFTCLSIVVAVVVMVVARRVRSVLWGVGLGFLLAGVLGNLTDRIVREPSPFHGHVIDFLQLPNWPVFNVADMCINVAAAVILFQAVRGIRLDGTSERAEAAESDDPRAGE